MDIAWVGKRAYIGDITCFFIDVNTHELEKIINVEIDGFEGHSSKYEKSKNSIRDTNLKEGVTFQYPAILSKILVYDDVKVSQKKVPCSVLRFSAYLRGVSDSDIQDEIDDFYFDVKKI